jgi:hypothetical protein
MRNRRFYLPLSRQAIVRALMAMLAVAIVLTPIALLAQSGKPAPMRIYGGVIVTVDSHDGPWLQSLNPAYDYGYHDNSAPAIVNQANSGIVFTPGHTLTITYMSGLVSAGGALPFVDANGDVNGPYGCGPGLQEPNPNHLPCHYTDLSKKTYLMELLGVFTDSSGTIVGQPFSIGDGPFHVAIPAGAAQLQMGVNDDIYYDNMGSFAIQVTYYGPTPCSL